MRLIKSLWIAFFQVKFGKILIWLKKIIHFICFMGYWMLEMEDVFAES